MLDRLIQTGTYWQCCCARNAGHADKNRYLLVMLLDKKLVQADKVRYLLAMLLCKKRWAC